MTTTLEEPPCDSPRMADSESVDFTPLHLVWKPWHYRLRIGRGFVAQGLMNSLVVVERFNVPEHA